MKTDQELKELVQSRYSEIAQQSKDTNASSCCGSGCCTTDVETIMTDDYSKIEGYQSQADLGLGCGLPTQFAGIKEGDVVIDLGSGAGNDCFIARHETGERGKVIGIDFTAAMIGKARNNNLKLGFNNVEFRQGDIEAMPAMDEEADVVISNCVLNLVPNKKAVFKEIYRVLKQGGHFSISDIVLVGDLPESIRQAAEMYAGCVSGAVQKEEYLEQIKNAGFKNISIKKEKPIYIPKDILMAYMPESEAEKFQSSDTGIFSITVYAEKQLKKSQCCDDTCCT